MAEVFVTFAIDGNAEAYAFAQHVLAANGFHNSATASNRRLALPQNCVGRTVDGEGVSSRVHEEVVQMLVGNGVRLTHLVVVELKEIAVADRSAMTAWRAAATANAMGVASDARSSASRAAGQEEEGVVRLDAVPGSDAPFPWGNRQE